MALYMDIDASELSHTIDGLRKALTPQKFNTAMTRALRRTGTHVRKIMRQDLPKHYEVKPGMIQKAVGNPQVQGFGDGVGCIVPVRGERHSIGGTFKASGGAHGWASVKRKYRVKGKILKGAISTLPAEMGNVGGKPPFRNLSAKKLNNVAFTRKSNKRLPIQKVVGIGIPQMPMNRSQDDVQEDVVNYLKERIEHEYDFIIGNIGK